jgi:hypothetical protein
VIPREEWEWLGHAGHLVVSNSCLHHLCTRVGDVLVSTVGDYRPRHLNGKRDTIGSDRYYETFVFRLDSPARYCRGNECNCGMPEWTGSEIDSLPAQTGAEANANHMMMCLKWADPATAEATVSER